MAVAGRAAAGHITLDEVRLCLGLFRDGISRQPSHARVALVAVVEGHRHPRLIAGDDHVRNAVRRRAEVWVELTSSTPIQETNCAEPGSTGAALTSWFHQLVAGNTCRPASDSSSTGGAAADSTTTVTADAKATSVVRRYTPSEAFTQRAAGPLNH